MSLTDALTNPITDGVTLTVETGEISRKQTLFDIGAELDAIYEAYDRLEGDEAEVYLKAALEAYFDQVGERLNDKLDGYCNLIKSAEAKAKIREDEAKRLKGLADTDRNFAQRLKDRLKYWLEVTGNTKVETPYHKIAVQANGGAVPLIWIASGLDGEPVEVRDPGPDWVNTLPQEYVKQVPTIDNEAIRKSLESGEELPFAKLGDRGFHLRIR